MQLPLAITITTITAFIETKIITAVMEIIKPKQIAKTIIIIIINAMLEWLLFKSLKEQKLTEIAECLLVQDQQHCSVALKKEPALEQ